MTGYTVHTGSSIKFSHGWDRIFSGSGAAAGKPLKPAASGKQAPAKKAAKASKKKRRA